MGTDAPSPVPSGSSGEADDRVRIGVQPQPDGSALVAYREEGGYGRLVVEHTRYIPTPEATTAKLDAVAKAWPVLAQHAPHMDGSFDLALSDLRRMVDALHSALASRSAVPEQGNG